MSVMLFFLRYSSCRFTQFSKSDNVLIRFTLNANTSTPRMRLMMDTSLSSLPQQFSFLIAAKSDCLDLAMTISSVSRAIVLPDLRRVSCYPVQGIRQTLIALLCFTPHSLFGHRSDLQKFTPIRFICFLLYNTHA